MNIESQKSLKPYTTFAVDVNAKYFVQVNNISELQDLISDPLWQEEKHYIIGKGSNILFTKDFDGIIVYNNLEGIDIINEDEEKAMVGVAAGEDWHRFVMWTVDRGLWGIENLALIPGTVGAAPVQNIGAYGVEAKDTIVSVDVIDLVSGEVSTLRNDECDFGYRTSIFKQRPHYFVTKVTFQLSKQPHPRLEYGSMKDQLTQKGIEQPTLGQVAETVIAIRKSKLPDVGEISMAGSFFKNPITTSQHAQEILARYPDMPHFDLPDGQVKVPAGWLLETLGYKGIIDGKVGTYNKHALVLVNHGGATGAEVWEFAQKMMRHVHDTFGLDLEPEVIIM